ncbi:hypothetical protein B0H13DRAFT_1110102 [Mycena leptocephala]|nr:hypothetical protein B0H13DRAFT_1110102 [Mycena leptocephala]
MPPEGAAAHTPFYPSRGSGPRPRGHANGNGFAAVDQKLANMSIQDNGSSRSQSNDPGTRARGGPGGKGGPNAPATKRASMVKQRVPNADEFPVLGGSTTPPILQAPRPVRSSSSSQAITPRGVTPERVKEVKADVNGTEVHSLPKLPVSFASVATAASDVSVAA